MGKYLRSKKRRTPIIAICITAIIVFGAIVGGYQYMLANRTLPTGMTMAGVYVGDLKKDEAIEALSNAMQNTYSQTPLEITVENYTVSIPASVSKVSLDIETLIEVAFSESAQAKVYNILPYLSLDQAAIKESIREFDVHFDSDYTESSYEVVGQRPSLTADDVTGEGQKLVLYAGTPDYTVDLDALYQEILSCYNCGIFTIDFPLIQKYPERLDIDAIYNEVCIAPQDAVMDMETFEVSQHTYGYVFDKSVAQSILPNISYGSSGEVPFERVAPQVYKQELTALLYRDELGTYTAYASSDVDRDVNLRLSCEAINNIILFPGDVFSYNKTLGKRTPEKGYKPAAGYLNGETVIDYGGGICQASSSLYYCALLADIEIVERHNHGFVSAYMPLGMDATVDWLGPDLKIKNTTQYPIRIEASASGGTVSVSLWGTDTKDYYVKMYYEIVEQEDYETVYVEMNEDNEKGLKDGDIINTPYTGYTINTYKYKYDKQTDELISYDRETQSYYAKRDEEICKIIPPETTAPPETTTPGVSGTVTEDG